MHHRLSWIPGRIRNDRHVPGRGEHGAETTEWILIVVGALIIGGIVLLAIQGFVDGQIAKLPG